MQIWFCQFIFKGKRSHLKGLCHGSPVHLFNVANYPPSVAMELKVSKEITCK